MQNILLAGSKKYLSRNPRYLKSYDMKIDCNISDEMNLSHYFVLIESIPSGKGMNALTQKGDSSAIDL